MSEEGGGGAGECSAVPLCIPLPDPTARVASIACGGNHNLALTTSNEVYSWGYGDMLALGHGEC